MRKLAADQYDWVRSSINRVLPHQACWLDMYGALLSKGDTVTVDKSASRYKVTGFTFTRTDGVQLDGKHSVEGRRLTIVDAVHVGVMP